jgi:hypothetical protein
MTVQRALLLTLLLAACSDKSGEGDTGGGAGDGGFGGGDGGGASDQAPSIEAMDAWCYQHTTGDEQYFWVAAVTADDPQGADTLESFFDGITVLQGGTEVATYAMVCGQDGSCSASWNQTEDNVACSNASAYTIQAMVTDDEGNWSAPSEVTGKQCGTASGC